MENKLIGTDDNCMHAYYLATKVCDLNSTKEAELAAEFGGEDGLVMELIPYGLTLGKVIDAIYEEKQDFPGVPAYDLSEGAVGVWMFEYLNEHNKLPNMEVWENLCTNMVRAWCQQDLEEFRDLDYKQQIFVDSGKVGIVKLLNTPAPEEEPPRLPNGEAISVANVKKLAVGTGMSVARVIDILKQMPRGTQFVNLSLTEYIFWRKVDTKLLAYSNNGEGFWYQPPHKPTNLVEYQKFIDIHYDSPEQKQARVEQELNMILVDTEEKAAELFNLEIQPDTNKPSERLIPDAEFHETRITDVAFNVQLDGLDILGQGNTIDITFKDLKVKIVDGKVTDLKHPMFNV